MSVVHNFLDGNAVPSLLELHEDGSNLTEAQYAALTRVVLTLSGGRSIPAMTLDTDTTSNVVVDSVNRRISLTLGVEVGVLLGRYLTSVVAYSVDNPGGVHFATPGQYVIRKTV